MIHDILYKWEMLPMAVKNAIYIVVGCALLLKLIQWFTNGAKSKNRDHTRMVMLLKQAARWAAAAEQDTSLLLAIMHANYAAAYLTVMKEMYDIHTLDSACGAVSFSQLEQNVMDIQNKIQGNISETCSAITPVSAMEAYSLL